MDLQNNINRRQGILTSTRDSVLALKGESEDISKDITKNRLEQNQQVLALSQEEVNHVKAIFAANESNIDRMLTLEDEIRNNLNTKLNLEKQTNQVLLETQQQVAEERDLVLEASNKLVEVDQAGAKEAIFLATQEDLANLLPGVPDYVRAKKRLISTANYILNLMRSRYRSISGLASEGFNNSIISGDLGQGAYITRISQVQEVNQLWTTKNILNESAINVEKPVIDIPANSLFSQKLLSAGRVVFQISPRVRADTYTQTKQYMADNGYLTLWDPSFDNGNPRLVDVMARISFEAGDSCEDQSPNFTLVHYGHGYLYPPSQNNPDNIPALWVGPQLSASQGFLQPNAMTRYQNKKLVWDASPRVNTFDKDNTGSDAARYLGLPAAATYELILHKHACMYTGNGLQLFLAVATDTPN